MKRLKISEGGQVSVPAEIRRRWRTRTVVAEDRGDHLILRPAPDNPVVAARGAFRARLTTDTERMRSQARADERRAETRRG